MTRSQPRMLMARALSTVGLLALFGTAGSAVAQDANTAGRLTKVEAEVRALQRKVFPGSDGKYFSPEITPGSPTPTPAPLPSTTPLTDVLTRMDALETQVARMTGQVEQNTNRISQLEAKLAAFAATPAAAPDALGGMTGSPPPSRPANSVTAASPAASPAPSSTPPPPSRVKAVSAIAKPSTGDAIEDEYSYGFRLWEAKFYPEAQQQLKLFLEKYPRSSRASWARNLLGRAYLDDKNALEAAKWFVQNYQTDKQGERAPDSLLYLAVSMKQLNDTKRACIALAEFGTTYAAEAAGRLKGQYDATRNGLKCTS